MQPRNTLYRLMEPTDEPILKKIWADHKKRLGPVGDIDFPTVVAERDGTILGALTTESDNEGQIYVRPVVVPPCAFMVFYRLFEAYENVLRLAGIKSYMGGFPKRGHKKLMRMIESLGIKPYYEFGGTLYYRRDL